MTGTLYAAANPWQPLAPFEGEATADALIIGGGLTGVSAALHLAEAGARVILLEAQHVGFGASGRNGGQVHSGYRGDPKEIDRQLGRERADALWALAEEAKATIRDRIERHSIACHPRPNLLTAAWRPSHVGPIQAEAEFVATRFGYPVRWCDAAAVEAGTGSPLYAGGVLDEGAFHLDPLALLQGLARAATGAGAMICEGSAVTRLDRARPHRAATAAGAVAAPAVILALDTWMPALAPELEAYAAPLWSYVGATAPLDPALRVLPADWAVADTKFDLDYYRLSHDGRLVFGGGETYADAHPDPAAIVRVQIERVFPQLRGTFLPYAWPGAVGITASRALHLGMLAPGLWFAHGFSGHGVALAVLAGKLLAEAVTGAPERMRTLQAITPPRLPGGWLRKPLLRLVLAGARLWDRFV